jgi:hypothetical protein
MQLPLPITQHRLLISQSTPSQIANAAITHPSTAANPGPNLSEPDIGTTLVGPAPPAPPVPVSVSTACVPDAVAALASAERLLNPESVGVLKVKLPVPPVEGGGIVGVVISPTSSVVAAPAPVSEPLAALAETPGNRAPRHKVGALAAKAETWEDGQDLMQAIREAPFE